MNLVSIGMIIIFIGFILVFLGSLISKENLKTSGGIFIGPFPLFGFGNKKLFYILWVFAIILFIAFSLVKLK
ncbi:DUF131 domain-containing protein [Candidatus Woesearchaeota archaeon]|nr:DUF131 domain-containing protein [Candidatus Woesearchaeota archaeon]